MSYLMDFHRAHVEARRRLDRPLGRTPIMKRVELELPPPPDPDRPGARFIFKQLAGTARCRIIKEAVCIRWKCCDIDIVGPCRKAYLIWPRFFAIHLTFTFTDLSTLSIGKLFHRDHSTVIHSRDKMELLRATIPAVEDEIQYMIDRLDNYTSIEARSAVILNRDFT